MTSYTSNITIRWADLDPNFHVLHSKYYDFGAFCRMEFFTSHGITVEQMKQNHIGPIIFREECFFRRELRFGDTVTITLTIDSATKDYRKWSLKHELFKNGDTLAALISVDGSWMDQLTRKIVVPPAPFTESFEAIPRSKDFKFME